MQAHELYPALGLKPGQHLPRDGFAPRYVQNIMFRCLPAERGNKGHRVLYLCACGQWIPFGRAAQHEGACRAVKDTAHE